MLQKIQYAKQGSHQFSSKVKVRTVWQLKTPFFSVPVFAWSRSKEISDPIIVIDGDMLKKHSKNM